jgi:hypothetical protein
MVTGEPDSAARAPEGPAEYIETVSLPLFAAASIPPLGLNATAVAEESGGEPPTAVSVPEAPTEKTSVPWASSVPPGLNARPDPPLIGVKSGEPGARV